jgi:hypothetical protein
VVGTAKCCLLQGACVGNGRGPPAVANERLHRFRKRWVWATRVGGSGPTSVGRCPALQAAVRRTLVGKSRKVTRALKLDFAAIPGDLGALCRSACRNTSVHCFYPV